MTSVNKGSFTSSFLICMFFYLFSPYPSLQHPVQHCLDGESGYLCAVLVLRGKSATTTSLG